MVVGSCWGALLESLTEPRRSVDDFFGATCPNARKNVAPPAEL